MFSSFPAWVQRDPSLASLAPQPYLSKMPMGPLMPTDHLYLTHHVSPLGIHSHLSSLAAYSGIGAGKLESFHERSREQISLPWKKKKRLKGLCLTTTQYCHWRHVNRSTSVVCVHCFSETLLTDTNDELDFVNNNLCFPSPFIFSLSRHKYETMSITSILGV